MEERGRVFDPLDVGVARAFYVAKDQADKDAALERRMEAQRRLEAISNAPDGTKSKASIMAYSDTREASEESALYGTPDEIARKTRKDCAASASDMSCSTAAVCGSTRPATACSRFAREVMPAFAAEAQARVVG